MSRNFSFSVDKVLPYLKNVVSLTNAKTTLPILECVKLYNSEENPNVLCMTCSDSESWLTTKCNVQSQSVFNICINAKKFLNVISGLGGYDIVATIDETKNIVVCDYKKGSFELPYESSENFVESKSFDDMEKVTSFEVGGMSLYNAMSTVQFGMADDELRPVLNGVHIEFGEDGTEFVATDGRVLALCKDKGLIVPQGSFTLPSKPSRILLPLLYRDTPINVQYDDAIIVLNGEDFTFTTRMIMGKYPNYKSIIPTDYVRDIKIDKSELTSALKHIIPLGNDTNKLVIFNFEFGNNFVCCENVDFSTSAKEFIECEDNNTEKFRIGFLSSLVLSCLTSVSSAKVHLFVKDPQRAAVMIPDTQNDTIEYKVLLMPLVIN